jgi:thiosulfate reductase/polysulfide reductase chain A
MQDILKALGEKLSKPLFDISKKYDEDLQDSIADMGEKRAFLEGGYNLAELYKDDTTLRNKKLILSQFGEDVYNSLKNRGVWYPYIESQKELGNSLYEYYPKESRDYSIERKYTVTGYLKKLKKHAYDAMPTWHDSYDFVLPKDHFRMITGRYITSTQSASANNAILHDMQDTNHIWINNKVAQSYGIKEGDYVSVSSAIARVVIKAYPTNKIAPDVVWFAHGFGINSEEMTGAFGSGACDNMIIEDKFEKIYGCATMHETNVRIRKI